MKLRILLITGFVLVLLGTSLPAGVIGQSDTPTPPPGAMLSLEADAIVRAWPAENGKPLGKLPAGSSVPTNGRLEDSSWWQVPYPGGPNGNGWVPASDVQPNAAAGGVTVYALPTATPAPSGAAMVTLTVDGTVMAWPDDNASKLGELPAGSSVPTNGRLQDSSWWRVPYPGGPNSNGWLMASVVQPDAAAAAVTVLEVIVPTPEAPVTPTPAACQFNSAFVTDVTIPDGTEIQAAQSFDKVWRVENSGTCPWGPGTLVNFIGGLQMSAPPTVTVPSTAPGQTADIGVTMYAPSSPGAYNSIWQMENQGQFFGTKLNALIHVPGDAAPTAAPPPPPPPPAPTGAPQPGIDFWADTDRVNAGQCTNLHWNVQQAQAVYLEYNNQTHGVAGQSSQQVCPSTDGKRYTLHVISQDGQQNTRDVQINVSNPSVSIKFWADKDKVTIGTCTNVNWNVSNAQQVQYNDGGGWKNVDKNGGSRKVCPSYPITCQLRVTDMGGQTHDRSLTINTKAPPPGIITPTAN